MLNLEYKVDTVLIQLLALRFNALVNNSTKVRFFWDPSQDMSSSGFPPKKLASNWQTRYASQSEACFWRETTISWLWSKVLWSQKKLNLAHSCMHIAILLFSDMGYHTMVTTTSESPPPFREPPPPAPPTLISMDSRKLQVMYKNSGNSTTTINGRNKKPVVSGNSQQQQQLHRQHSNIALFDTLSDDLVLKILSFLPTNVLCLCARVCRRFYFLVWEPQLWTQIKLTVNNCDQTLATLLRLLSR